MLTITTIMIVLTWMSIQLSLKPLIQLCNQRVEIVSEDGTGSTKVAMLAERTDSADSTDNRFTVPTSKGIVGVKAGAADQVDQPNDRGPRKRLRRAVDVAVAVLEHLGLATIDEREGTP